jgi:hypothetical protein
VCVGTYRRKVSQRNLGLAASTCAQSYKLTNQTNQNTYLAGRAHSRTSCSASETVCCLRRSTPNSFPSYQTCITHTHTLEYTLNFLRKSFVYINVTHGCVLAPRRKCDTCGGCAHTTAHACTLEKGAWCFTSTWQLLLQHPYMYLVYESMYLCVYVGIYVYKYIYCTHHTHTNIYRRSDSKFVHARTQGRENLGGCGYAR